MDYLLNIKKMPEQKAKTLCEKVSKYGDIRVEFENWIENGGYPENPLVIEGYSARDISKLAPFMDGIGVFTFMAALRENPERAKGYIKEGFKRR
jgi:hypothetical protein